MKYLISIQLIFTAAYFLVADIHYNIPLILILSINILSGLYLFWFFLQPNRQHNLFLPIRWSYTISLIIVELLLAFTSSPEVSEKLFYLLNDLEVFITGVFVGYLWKIKPEAN